MRSALRAALLAGAALALAAPTFAAEPVKAPGEWGQAVSDLKPEAGIRFGRLANGMRYALMRNATPTGEASLRLRIGAGSLMEGDDQTGLAHFLEHMAFKGSTHVPAGDMVQILQRKGLAFGPDTNAETDFDQTVYKLDLPRTDADTLSTGMMLLREVAGELTLSQAAMDPERGVVLSEERGRDTPGYRSLKAQIGFTLEGQRAPSRFPIGMIETLKTAPVSRIRAFYDAWYRPENATLIAVGDFDLDAMEKDIRARFGDWKGRGAPGVAPDLGRVKARGEAVSLHVEAGGPQQLQLAWAVPHDPTADTAARERRDTVEELALAVLNRRFDTLARSTQPPFIAAQVRREDEIRSAKITALSVRTTPEGWSKGLAAAVEEQRRAVQYGVTAAELAREVTEQRTRLTQELAQTTTRQTRQLADRLVETVNDDEVATSPAQNLATFESAVKGLTPAEVDAALKAAFTGSGPLVYLGSAQPVAGGEATVKGALDQALSAPVKPPVAAAAVAWPYANFGPPGKVVATREIAGLGATAITFANGVKLLVKPTAFTKDQILMEVRVGQGRSGLPRDRASPTWETGAVIAGGTHELTYAEIERASTGKAVGVQLALGDDAYTLQGATRPADLDFELQLATAYLTKPGFRPEAFERLRGAIATVLPQIDSTPGGVLSRDLGQLTHAGDPRWRALPTPEELAAAKPADLAGSLAPILQGGPLDITVVGDLTVAQATAAVARTLGALPPRGARKPAPPEALRVRFPDGGGEPRIATHKGRADQAIAFVAWPSTDYFADVKETRALNVAAAIFENRLTDQVRVVEGASYSPSANSDPSQVFPGYGYVAGLVETPPSKVESFFANTRRITAAMRAQPPSADELERAKRPLVETRKKAMQQNPWWLAVLSRIPDEPRQAEVVRTAVSGVEAVTAAEVQAVAAKYLTDARAWRMVVRSATPAPGDPQAQPTPVGAGPKPPLQPQGAPSPDAPAPPVAAPKPGAG